MSAENGHFMIMTGLLICRWACWQIEEQIMETFKKCWAIKYYNYWINKKINNSELIIFKVINKFIRIWF